jgi:hypothetical protein
VGRAASDLPQKKRAIAEARSRPTRSTPRCSRSAQVLSPTTCRGVTCSRMPDTRCAGRSRVALICWRDELADCEFRVGIYKGPNLSVSRTLLYEKSAPPNAAVAPNAA